MIWLLTKPFFPMYSSGRSDMTDTFSCIILYSIAPVDGISIRWRTERNCEGEMGELFRRRKDEQFFRRSKVLRAKLRCVDFLPDAARQMRARASCQDRIDFQLLNSTRNLRISKNSCFDSAR